MLAAWQGRAQERARKSSISSIGPESDRLPTPEPGGSGGSGGGGGGGAGARQEAVSLALDDLRSEAALLEGADDPAGVRTGGVGRLLQLEHLGVSPEGGGVSDLEAVLLVGIISLPISSLPHSAPPPPPRPRIDSLLLQFVCFCVPLSASFSPLCSLTLEPPSDFKTQRVPAAHTKPGRSSSSGDARNTRNSTCNGQSSWLYAPQRHQRAPLHPQQTGRA